jgi:hypothetical protein
MSIMRDTDELWHAHRRAAANIDAAAAFRERVEGRCFRDADLRGGRQFEPAADNCAMQHRDDR